MLSKLFIFKIALVPILRCRGAHRTAAAETCPKPMTGALGATRTATGSTHAGADKIRGNT